MNRKAEKYTDKGNAAIAKLVQEGLGPTAIAKIMGGHWTPSGISACPAYRTTRYAYLRTAKLEPAPSERPSIVEYDGLRIKRIETFVTTYSPLGISTGRTRISLSGGLV